MSTGANTEITGEIEVLQQKILACKNCVYNGWDLMVENPCLSRSRIQSSAILRPSIHHLVLLLLLLLLLLFWSLKSQFQWRKKVKVLFAYFWLVRNDICLTENIFCSLSHNSPLLSTGLSSPIKWKAKFAHKQRKNGQIL